MAQLDLTLDRTSDVPLGTQLAWKVRGAIASGRLRPGDRLPGLRDLADRAGVNVNTVRTVLGRLGEQGLIVSEHGRGTFVAEAGGRAELAHLAERTAREAREGGFDPRELAALLYAAAGGSASEQRRELRDAIERLERQRVEVEIELAALGDAPVSDPPPVPRPRRTGAPGARILSTDELMAVREAVADQVADLRGRLAAARRAPAGPPRSSGVRPAAQTATGGGTWTLRW